MTARIQPIAPIEVLDLFAGERAALLDLLSGLSDAAWAAPTVCAGWSVKDVALHLLGDDVGRLSWGRDGFPNPSFGGPDVELDSWSGLVAAIDRQNAAWVEGTRRVSAPLLIELLHLTGEATDRYFRTLDLATTGMPVDWAGSEAAPVWLDVAREYTERWVHQQHIRDAVGHPGLKERRWFGPVLEAFVLGMRRALRDTGSSDGTAVRLVISGDAGGQWVALRSGDAWVVGTAPDILAAAKVELPQEVAWRLFTKGIDHVQARRSASIAGDSALADRVLETVSILA